MLARRVSDIDFPFVNMFCKLNNFAHVVYRLLDTLNVV